jgi:hypothetical protein
MKSQANAARRHPARREIGRETQGWLARALGNAAYGLLALAALGVVVSVASCVASTTSARGVNGSVNRGASATSGASTALDNGIDGAGWIPLRSQAPADILAAAHGGALLHDAQTGDGDGPHNLTRLGTPTLVRALRPAGVSASQAPDFYVVPILNAAGAATDALELALNPARTAVQEIAIITYSAPRAAGAIAQLRQDQALQMIAKQRQLALRSGAQPYLIYFLVASPDPTTLSDPPLWSGGGALPADPIWLIPAADGQAYLAGNDGVVYAASQLPFAAAQ